MPASEVSISNLALQKLGAKAIVTLTEDSKSARECNKCYEFLRDQQLRAHVWNFAKTRKTLAPDAAEPDFDFLYAFTLPADYLRLLPPKRLNLDWRIENHNGARSILTNDGDTLKIIYIARITDPNMFDELFIEMFASKMAWHMCEAITQSNTKKDDALRDYKIARDEAKRINAFENISDEEPEDPWLAARR